jgi:predicted nucleic acid-binding protein
MTKFLFETSVIIDYLHGQDVAADALFRASELGTVYISKITLLELWLPRHLSRRRSSKPPSGQRLKQPSDEQIRQEIKRVCALRSRLNLKIVPCSPASQEFALTILERCHSPLGRTALPDSLLMGTGIATCDYIVTSDTKWPRVMEQLMACNVIAVPVEVISPVQLVRDF